MHPHYGLCIGGYAHRYIEESWRKKFRQYTIEQVAPVLFATWPHWKKLLWMAKNEGKWDIKVFREPKGAKIKKSLYGKKRIELRLGIPKLRKKFKKPVEVRKPGKVKPKDIIEQAMYAELGIPMDPVVVPQPGRIYDMPAGWANQVVQQHNIAFANGLLGGAGNVAAPQAQNHPWFNEEPPIEAEIG